MTERLSKSNLTIAFRPTIAILLARLASSRRSRQQQQNMVTKGAGASCYLSTALWGEGRGRLSYSANTSRGLRPRPKPPLRQRVDPSSGSQGARYLGHRLVRPYNMGLHGSEELEVHTFLKDSHLQSKSQCTVLAPNWSSINSGSRLSQNLTLRDSCATG